MYRNQSKSQNHSEFQKNNVRVKPLFLRDSQKSWSPFPEIVFFTFERKKVDALWSSNCKNFPHRRQYTFWFSRSQFFEQIQNQLVEKLITQRYFSLSVSDIWMTFISCRTEEMSNTFEGQKNCLSFIQSEEKDSDFFVIWQKGVTLNKCVTTAGCPWQNKVPGLRRLKFLLLLY